MNGLKTFAYGLLTGLVVGAIAAVAIGRIGYEPVTTRTRIVYRNRPAPPRLTVPPVAAVRTLYSVRVDTVVVRVPVPVDLDPVGVVGDQPIEIRGREVRLRYWSPDSLRFVQDTFRFRQPRFGWGLVAGTGRDAAGAIYAGIGLEGRYDRFSAAIGPAFTDHGAAISFALRYRIVGQP